MSPAQIQLFDEAAEFGIRCGFTIPIRDGRGPIAAVTFASDQRRPAFNHTIQSNERVLQLMAIVLHAHARRKLYAEPAEIEQCLSPRELQCLRWAAAGKSSWEIAQILGIAQRTVVFHFENAKRKLGVLRLREKIVEWAATLESGNASLEARVRGDIAKASSELRRIRRYKEFSESPIIFGTKLLLGQIPIVSNLVSAVEAVGWGYDRWISRRNLWVAIK